MKLRIAIPELGANKRRLEIILLVVLVAALLGGVVNHVVFGSRSFQRATICKDCGYRELKTMSLNLLDFKCAKCGGQVGIAHKCVDCAYEFTVVPLQPKQAEGKTLAERRQYEIDRHRCPNCYSPNTYMVSLKDFDARN